MKKGEKWVAVKPLPGALVINVGDLLQILSNDEYKSGEHRVLANPLREPRTSVAVFISVDENNTSSYGPLEEMLSPAKPPLYRNFTLSEIKEIFLSKELGKISLPNEFRLLEKQE
ncbi:1-aminocyclopropane-1-carboxylate oxidase-like protein [Thalictrum thalictroides]|uniref:1-aminocyclopropane-1-carboxylate oxidase-like protein n=1 Tax=Thalictrum thalictroides TaxID=46969 RepID=A0A7J6XAE2_THATH|nr:1-aminocyclopropane-1-carboxylate oxidase-like protein [Thalictrum thalictroides]